MEDHEIFEDQEKDIVLDEENAGFDTRDLLSVMLTHEASDLYLVPGSTPTVKLEGNLISIGSGKLSAGLCSRLVGELLDGEQKAALQAPGRITFPYSYEGKALTVECVAKDGTLSATVRVM